jgi:hypothetical protein
MIRGSSVLGLLTGFSNISSTGQSRCGLTYHCVYVLVVPSVSVIKNRSSAVGSIRRLSLTTR